MHAIVLSASRVQVAFGVAWKRITSAEVERPSEQQLVGAVARNRCRLVHGDLQIECHYHIRAPSVLPLHIGVTREPVEFVALQAADTLLIHQAQRACPSGLGTLSH